MSKLPNFGSAKLEKVCKYLEFEIYDDRGKGGHKLAKHPTRKPTSGQMPHITIPSWKSYDDPNFRSKIVREIMTFGFTRDEIIKAINKA